MKVSEALGSGIVVDSASIETSEVLHSIQPWSYSDLTLIAANIMRTVVEKEEGSAGYTPTHRGLLTGLDKACDFLDFREVMNVREAVNSKDIGVSSEFLTIEDIGNFKMSKGPIPSGPRLGRKAEQDLIAGFTREAFRSGLNSLRKVEKYLDKGLAPRHLYNRAFERDIFEDLEESKRVVFPTSYPLYVIMVAHWALTPRARVLTLPFHFIQDILMPNISTLELDNEEGFENLFRGTMAYIACHFRKVRFTLDTRVKYRGRYFVEELVSEGSEGGMRPSDEDIMESFLASIPDVVIDSFGESLESLRDDAAKSDHPEFTSESVATQAISGEHPRILTPLLPQLKELEIIFPSGYEASEFPPDAYFDNLIQFGHLSLKHIHCSGSWHSDFPFGGYLNLSRLESLTLAHHYNYKMLDTDNVDLGRHLPTLQRLTFENCWFYDTCKVLEGMKGERGQLEGPPILQELTLSFTVGIPYGDNNGILEFVTFFQDTLRYLCLKGIEQSFKLAAPKLERLEMCRCVGLGSVHLCVPRLHSLELTECFRLRSLTVESGLLSTLDLRTCVDLEHVDVSKCPADILVQRLKPPSHPS